MMVLVELNFSLYRNWFAVSSSLKIQQQDVVLISVCQQFKLIDTAHSSFFDCSHYELLPLFHGENFSVGDQNLCNPLSF